MAEESKGGTLGTPETTGSNIEPKPQSAPPEGTPHPALGVLTLTIKDKAVLYSSYMSFLKEGGLFIPTSRSFNMGEEISMVVHLMEETEKFPVKGNIVWITPKEAQGNRAPGIGVQFKGEEGKLLRNKIETYLAGALKSDKPTHSM